MGKTEQTVGIEREASKAEETDLKHQQHKKIYFKI